MSRPFSYEWLEEGLGLEIKIFHLGSERALQEFKQFIEEWFAEGVVLFRFNFFRASGIGFDELEVIRDTISFLRQNDAEVEFVGVSLGSGFLEKFLVQAVGFEISESFRDEDEIQFN